MNLIKGRTLKINRDIRFVLLIFIALTLWLPNSCFAQVSFDASSEGAVRIGYSSNTCNAGAEGELRYDSTPLRLDYCDGTSWVPVPRTLNDLSDVDVSGANYGAGLLWDGSLWNSGCSSTPDDFFFNDLTGVQINRTIYSNIVFISGFNCGTISIDDNSTGGSPSFRVCADSGCQTTSVGWTSSDITDLNGGTYIQLRVLSDADGLVTKNVTLTVGSVARNWDVTTMAGGPPGALKRMFVTSSSYVPSSIGGIAGADGLCNTHAALGSLSGTFKAWLAIDGTDDPDARFTKSTDPYYNTVDWLIAENYDDLTDGQLYSGNNVLRYDEYGVSHAAFHHSWSNVKTDGTFAGTDHCSGWTSASTVENGNTGRDFANSYWTDNSFTACNNSVRILCFEQ